MCSAKDRSFIASAGTKVAVLPKAGLPPQTQEPRLQFYQGLNRSFQHPTLSLASEQILKDLKRCQGPQREGEESGFGWLGPKGFTKFTTGVKYQFHQGFSPDQRSGNPNHPSPPLSHHITVLSQINIYILPPNICLRPLYTYIYPPYPKGIGVNIFRTASLVAVKISSADWNPSWEWKRNRLMLDQVSMEGVEKRMHCYLANSYCTSTDRCAESLSCGNRQFLLQHSSGHFRQNFSQNFNYARWTFSSPAARVQLPSKI